MIDTPILRISLEGLAFQLHTMLDAKGAEIADLVKEEVEKFDIAAEVKRQAPVLMKAAITKAMEEFFSPYGAGGKAIREVIDQAAEGLVPGAR